MILGGLRGLFLLRRLSLLLLYFGLGWWYLVRVFRPTVVLRVTGLSAVFARRWLYVFFAYFRLESGGCYSSVVGRSKA